MSGFSQLNPIPSSQIATGTSGSLIPLLNGANTWSGVQTFTNSDIALLGSSTGSTTFTSANSGASNFTLTLPALTDTVATLAATQTLTNKSIVSTQLTGTLQAGQFPALTGDCTTSAGSLATTCTSINGVNQTTAWTSYTPTVTASTGTFTTTSATGVYKIIGKTIFIQGSLTITALGTASGRAILSAPGGITFSGVYPLSAFYSTLLAIPAAAAYDTVTSISISLTGYAAGIAYFSGVAQTT